MCPVVDTQERAMGGGQRVVKPRFQARPRADIAVPPSLAFLKESIEEVVFANYHLEQFEHQLGRVAPPDLAGSMRSAAGETPARRATRLLSALRQIERRLAEHLDRVVPALDLLSECGVPDLEIAAHETRQLLGERVIRPNLSVLAMDQDGGVRSPFRNLSVEQIVERLLQPPEEDEKGMHQAEKTLRNSTVVRDLQEQAASLKELETDPEARRALELAQEAMAQCAAAWGLTPGQGQRAAGPFSELRDELARMKEELLRRQETLVALGPRLEAFADPDAVLGEEVAAHIESFIEESMATEAPPSRAKGNANGNGNGNGTPRDDVARLFAPQTRLGQLAARRGALPVAQVARQVLAEASGRAGRNARGARLEKLAAGVGAYIRQQARASLMADPVLARCLMSHVVGLCNRAVANELAAISQRLEGVFEPATRRLACAREASKKVDAMLVKLRSDIAGGGRMAGGLEQAATRHPIMNLFLGLAERLRREQPLVDAGELEFLLESAVDYVRRRTAFLEQSAARRAYVERGWTASSRQNRMQKPLGDDVPTAAQLGRIDAELNEAYETLQADAQSFPRGEEFPISEPLSVLAALGHETLAVACALEGPLKEAFTDPSMSPTITALVEWTRKLDEGQWPQADGTSVADAQAEILGWLKTAPEMDESGMESALSLCERAGMAPAEVIGLGPASPGSAFLARHVGGRFFGRAESEPEKAAEAKGNGTADGDGARSR